MFYGSYFYSSSSFYWSIICLSISISTSWKSYVLWFILLFIFYLVFRNSSSLLLNGYSIYGLCLTFWTNEFLGSYSNYKFIISFSIFNRMGFWRILCSQSNIKEVLHFSLYSSIFQKDFFGLILVLCLYFLQTHFGVSSLSHPDNALEACALLTPLHIVPEWYFLCQYAMLK